MKNRLGVWKVLAGAAALIAACAGFEALGIFLASDARAEGAAAIQAPAAPAAADRMTQAGQLIQKGQAAYDALKGYEARMHRELRLKNGRLKIDEMYLRYDKPHTVFLKYTDGAQASLQVLYSEGKFDGKLMTRPPGPLFDFIPIVAMSPDDPRVKNEESRPIQNAGIGHMIEKFSADWAAAAAAGQASVVSIMNDEVAVYGVHAEPAVKSIRLEALIQTPGRDHPKVVVQFRAYDGLPIQMDLYPAGSASPDESYIYYAITPNPAMNDAMFVGMIDKRILELYKQI